MPFIIANWVKLISLEFIILIEQYQGKQLSCSCVKWMVTVAPQKRSYSTFCFFLLHLYIITYSCLAFTSLLHCHHSLYFHTFFNLYPNWVVCCHPYRLFQCSLYSLDERLNVWVMCLMYVQQSLMSKLLFGALIYHLLSPVPYNGMRSD